MKINFSKYIKSVCLLIIDQVIFETLSLVLFAILKVLLSHSIFFRFRYVSSGFIKTTLTFFIWNKKYFAQLLNHCFIKQVPLRNCLSKQP